MVRTGSVLLALGVLVAAGLTALLVRSLVGNDAEAERGLASEPKREPRPRTDGSARSEAPSPPRRPPPREPELLDVDTSRARVAEILATLTREPRMAGREALGAELQHLLSQLGNRTDAATKRQLLDLLVTIDPQGRRLVGRALGALNGDEETARRLLRLYREQVLPDIYATRAVFDALGRMRVQVVVPDLAAMLREESPHEILVVETLAAIGGPAASTVLLERLEHPARPEIRRSIVSALGKSRDSEILEAVADRLADADTRARASLVEILGLARDARFAARLRKLYGTEPDAQVRQQMLRALGRFGDRESARLLLETVERDGPEASHAIAALHEIRDPGTVDALAARWEELGPRARAALLGAAARLPDPSATVMATARRALREADEQTRMQAVHLLGRRGQEDNIEPLADLMEQGASEREQRAAAEALLRIGTPAAGRAVLSHLAALPAKVRTDYRARAKKILGQKRD